MIFIINNNVIFDTDNRTLSLLTNKNELIKLGTPVSELLTVLINHPNTLLSREYLLSEVLEKNFRAPSLNNLNNYISLLRKALRKFELDDIIVTTPKSGVTFNIKDICSIENNECEPVISPTVLQEIIPLSNVYAEKKSKFPSVIILLTIVILVLFILIIYSRSEHIPERNSIRINKSEKCNIHYLYKQISDGDDVFLSKSIEDICSDNTIYFYRKKISIPIENNKYKEVIISCKNDKIECVTYVKY